jgi:nicotinamidase/pyrazinamidase
LSQQHELDKRLQASMMESTVTARVELSAGDALLVADIQNDFLPGGALGVPEGDQVVPVLLGYIAKFLEKGLPIFASRDWHPPNHCSFKERGGIWPVHCVAGSAGAEPPPTFHLPSSAVIIQKATMVNKEAYSAFQDTPLDERLRLARVRRLFIGGLATEYCVLNTVKDAVARNYQVFLLVDGIRAVNLQPDDGPRAVEEMTRLGAVPIQLDNLI